MRYLWRCTLVLLVVLSSGQSFLLLFSRAGDTPALSLFAQQGCDSPCWHHLQLGKTTLKQAEVILRQDETIQDFGFSEDGLCWTFLNWQGCLASGSDQQAIDNLTFYLPDGNFRLGDAIRIFGAPLSSADACLFESDGPVETTALVSFAHNVQVTVSAPTPTFRLDPSMQVDVISYSFNPYLTRFTSPWRGFTALNESAGDCE